MDIAAAIPYATLILLVLNFAFGRGDKSSAKIDELEAKVHALELAQVGQYVTKGDMDLFRTEVRGHFQALRNDFNRVLAHYGPNAAFPD